MSGEEAGGRPTTPTLRLLWIIVAGLGVAAGAYLRFTQLRAQVLVDDEWHAIHKLVQSDAAGIATSFGLADHSIPLTLYYRELALHGGLTEWQMHLPLLLSGIALLVVAPLLLLRSHASLPVRATWLLLLAISPLLVYLSRTARPYALTCVLAFSAVLAFRNWWYRAPRGLAWATGYVMATALAAWLHLVTLPFTLLPFLYYGLWAIRSPTASDIRKGLSRLAYVAVATAIPLAIALLPPVLGSMGQLSEKAGADLVTVDSAYRTALMLFGITSPWLLVVSGLLCGAGVVHWWRRDRDFVAYVTFLCVGTLVAIVSARPSWVHHPLVLARYLLPALPFMLLFMAEGTIAVLARCLPLIRPPVVLLGAALLFHAGPIPAYLYRPNQFMGHQRFQFDYDPAHNPYVQLVPQQPIPRFYRDLARRPPGSLTLIEAPWRLESDFDPHPWYQEVHRQNVKIGLVTPTCGMRDFGEYPASNSMLRFRQFVHLSELLAGKSTGADYLVMHVTPWKLRTIERVEWPDVVACLPRIESVFGRPVYNEDGIVVFDIARNESNR
jgi:hypothetical protein